MVDKDKTILELELELDETKKEFIDLEIKYAELQKSGLEQKDELAKLKDALLLKTDLIRRKNNEQDENELALERSKIEKNYLEETITDKDAFIVSLNQQLIDKDKDI